MTCIDCIHYDLCEIRNKSISANPLKCGYKCPHFKDKSKFIELPCKVLHCTIKKDQFGDVCIVKECKNNA